MPRVEYTLSFENYQEMTQGRRDTPKMRAATFSAVLGLCLIAAGYGWLRLMPAAWSLFGGSLLGLGLVATFLAVLLGFFSRKKASRADPATLRSEYQHFHSDNRAIEFDEHGWRLFWYEGEDARPWSSLRAVHDQKTLLVLSTQTTHYWLPKSDLERAGQLDSLKSLAHGALNSHEKLFSIPQRPSLATYVIAWTVHTWRRGFSKMLLAYALVTLLFYWLFFSEPESAASHSVRFLLLGPLLLLAVEALYYARNYYFTKWSEAAREIEVSADCLSYATPAAQQILTYRVLQGFNEFPWGFHLYFEGTNFHLLPKKALSREQIAQFRELLSARA